MKRYENIKTGFNGTDAEKATTRKTDAGHHPGSRLAYTPQFTKDLRTHRRPAGCRHLAAAFARSVVLCGPAANFMVAFVPLLARPRPA